MRQGQAQDSADPLLLHMGSWESAPWTRLRMPWAMTNTFRGLTFGIDPNRDLPNRPLDLRHSDVVTYYHITK